MWIPNLCIYIIIYIIHIIICNNNILYIYIYINIYIFVNKILGSKHDF